MTSTMDVFSLVVTPGSGITIHNVLLVDVRQSEDGREVLTIEHQGIKRELQGGLRWNDKFSMGDVGRVGYLEPISMPLPSQEPDLGKRLDSRGSYFRAYVDPSLRRVVELDRAAEDGQVQAGWVCAAHSAGFKVPAGLIPGSEGRFVPDETVEVILRVPPEFVRECRRVQRTPLEVLRGFVGDAADIQSYINSPRADGYSSNGSDERDMAQAWIERAYGIDAIDLLAAEAQDYEEAERECDREDIGILLDEFVGYGGEARSLIKAVRDLVAKQASAADEEIDSPSGT